MSQNALGHSECRISKSTKSLEQIDEKASLFGWWYRFIEIKISLNNVGMGVVINMYVQSGHKTLKLALSQEEINGINWFLMCWYKFRKGKSYFNSFWVV